jgi:hypothetical protein
MVPLHMILKNQPAPRFTQESINTIKEIGDWFVDEEFSYIRIYGCEGAPHILPRYVPDRLVLREIAYQIVGVGIVASLSKSQKKKWPSFPIPLGIYSLLNAKHALKEVEQMEGIWLAQGNFKKHDPMGLVKKHCNMVKNVKAYNHEDDPFDIIFQRDLNYQEVAQ